MKQMHLGSSLQTSPSVKSSETPDGIVLLDVQQGMCFPLDHVGTLIWKGVVQERRVEEIAQQITGLYEIPFEQAHADVQEFIDQLIAQRLVLQERSTKRTANFSWIATVQGFWRRIHESHRFRRQ